MTLRRVARKAAAEPEPDEDYDDEPAEDEEPEEEEEGADVVRSGWSGYDETKAKSGAYAEFLKLEDTGEQTLIKFLEQGPFASYRQHWIEGLTSTRKKSFVCREDDCALCDAGDDPGFKVAFNVLVIPASGNKPVNKVWEVGPRLAEAIKGKAKDKRYGPLDRPDVYWAASRTGKKSKTQYSIDSVKARDLEEDWEVAPLSEAELERAKKKLYDKKVVRVPTARQLKEIAAELAEDELDDDDD